MEEESITSLHLDLHQGKHLQQISRTAYSHKIDLGPFINHNARGMIDQTHLLNLLDSFHVSSRLSSNFYMINPSTPVGAPQHLKEQLFNILIMAYQSYQIHFTYFETSILHITFINSYEHGAHIWVETAILVPIAIDENSTTAFVDGFSKYTAYP